MGLKKRKSRFPLIEVLGPIDCGKRIIAPALASMLSGSWIELPSFSTNTGRLLYSSLFASTSSVEAFPHWWAHIYGAHMLEHVDEIDSLRNKGPVIVTNYALAYKIWNSCLDFPYSTYETMVRGIETPDIGYIINSNLTQDNFKTIKMNLTPRFEHSVKFCMLKGGKDTIIVDCNQTSDYYHVNLNNTVRTIAEHASKKYKLPINYSVVFTADMFMKKKDL